MASSSQNNFEGSLDEYFNQHFNQYVDQTFSQYVDQTFQNCGGEEDERKERKKEFLSKEMAKKVMYVYGMTILVILQRILKIYSDDVSE